MNLNYAKILVNEITKIAIYYGFLRLLDDLLLDDLFIHKLCVLSNLFLCLSYQNVHIFYECHNFILKINTFIHICNIKRLVLIYKHFVWVKTWIWINYWLSLINALNAVLRVLFDGRAKRSSFRRIERVWRVGRIEWNEAKWVEWHAGTRAGMFTLGKSY